METRSDTRKIAGIESRSTTDRRIALPFAFVENCGQWPSEVRFRSELGSVVVFVEDAAFGVHVDEQCADGRSGHYVRMTFEGAVASLPLGEARTSARYCFFESSTPDGWVTNATGYQSVLYRDLYPRIDLRLREEGGRLEYDLLLAPGARLEDVVIRCEGVDGLCIDPEGSLTFETTAGPIRQAPPRTWEVMPDGQRALLDCSYVAVGTGRFGFRVPDREESRALVVDPGLMWSTFVGFSSSDLLHDLALHPSGDVVVVGKTFSPEFPLTPGAYSGGSGSETAFVARLTGDGAGLVYSVKIKGVTAEAVALHPDGGPILTGSATPGMPSTAGAVDPVHSGTGSDAFVLRLASNADGLVFSTFLGSTGGERGTDLAVDPWGRATVVGYTCSTSFPTTPGAFDPTTVGDDLFCTNRNAFVARLSEDGSSLDYSTYLGGDIGASHPGFGPDDLAEAVALDEAGSAVVVGYTTAVDFPLTPDAIKTQWDSKEAFVARLSPDGSALEYSTYLGGSKEERAYAVGIGPAGAINVVGWTNSHDFPVTPGAFDTLLNLTGEPTYYQHDVFLARLAPHGPLLFATFLGGGSDDEGEAVAVDASGVTTVAGWTASGSYPTTPGAFQTLPGGFFDADFFVTRLDPTGAKLLYSTLIGGAQDGPPDQQEVAMAIDSAGSAIAAASTGTDDFPITSGAFDPTPGAGADVVVFKFDMLPTGVSKHGSSTPACSGQIWMGVTKLPAAGAPGFAITCSAAPRGAFGVLVASSSAAASGIPVGGVLAWIDPSQVFAIVPVLAGADGYVETPVGLPSGAQGFAFSCQYGFLNTPSCPGSGQISASNALAIVVQ